MSFRGANGDEKSSSPVISRSLPCLFEEPTATRNLRPLSFRGVKGDECTTGAALPAGRKRNKYPLFIDVYDAEGNLVADFR
jgi:hypothetical protein